MIKINDDFKFPESILNQLAETSMGFLLIRIDEKGNFIPYIDASHHANHLSLMAYTENFLTALKSAEVEGILDNLRYSAEQQYKDDNESEEDDI